MGRFTKVQDSWVDLDHVIAGRVADFPHTVHFEVWCVRLYMRGGAVLQFGDFLKKEEAESLLTSLTAQTSTENPQPCQEDSESQPHPCESEEKHSPEDV